MGKGSFVLYNQWRKQVALLGESQKAMLLDAIFAIADGEEVEVNDPAVAMLLSIIGEQMQEDRVKYTEICKKRAQARKGNKKEQMITNDNNCNQTLSSATDNDNDNENDNENIINIYSPSKPDNSPKKKPPYLPDWATEVVDYLNEKTGKHFKVTSSANTKFISARAKEGYTADDFKKVIDTKTAEWKGTDMEQYLRPETLFSASKFEGYLNQRTIKKTSKNDFNNFDQHDYDMDELTKRAKRR